MKVFVLLEKIFITKVILCFFMITSSDIMKLTDHITLNEIEKG